VLPANATNQRLEVTSSDDSVASYFNGTIWGWSPGTATITFRATDGSGRTATHRVTVRPRPVPPVEEPEVLGASLPPGVLMLIEMFGFTLDAALAMWELFQMNDTGELSFINYVILMGYALVFLIMVLPNISSTFNSIFGPLIDAINALMRSTQPTPLRPVRIGNTTLTGGQRFAAGRPIGAVTYTRNHAGVDFAGGFGRNGVPLPNVYASTSGYVIRYYYFWEGTLGIDVLNDDGTILRYTELIATLPGLSTSSPVRNTPTQNVRIRVERGDVLGRLIPNTQPGNGSAVLHLEYYRGSATGALGTATVVSNRQVYDYLPQNITPRVFNRRRDLLDPTSFHQLPQW